MLNGIQNFLEIVNNNWTTIAVILGLCVALWKKIKDFLSKSNDEKIEVAKRQIQETMLKMITEAEIDFEDWNKAGSIKRSQVIGAIYNQYPILSKVADQTDMIAWIDNEINNSLKTLREVIKENKPNDQDG